MEFSANKESQYQVLFVTPVMPTRNGRGPGLRAYQWVQYLMKQFEKVTVLCTSVYGEYHPVPAEFIHHQQVKVFKSALVTSSLRRFLNVLILKPSTYNVVNSELDNWISGLKLQVPDLIIGFKITSLPVVENLKSRFKHAETALDIDEVNSKRVWDIAKLMRKNGLFWNAIRLLPEIVGYRLLESTALSEMNYVIVSTGEEKELFEEISSYRPCSVFENKFPAKKPAVNISNDPFQFLFVGNSIHYPNKDAIETIIDKILPEMKHQTTKEFKIVIIGGEPDETVKRKISQHSEIEYLTDTDDLETIYEVTDVALIPLRSGSGSSLKVLEAIANKKVVISTTTGIRGFSLKHKLHCLISDDTRILAGFCSNLIEDRELGTRLARNGYEWFLKNQSYGTI